MFLALYSNREQAIMEIKVDGLDRPAVINMACGARFDV